MPSKALASLLVDRDRLAALAGESESESSPNTPE